MRSKKYFKLFFIAIIFCAFFGWAEGSVAADELYVDCGAGVDGSGAELSPFNNLSSAFNASNGGTSDAWEYIYIKGVCRPCDGLLNDNCSTSYQTPTLRLNGSYLYVTTWPGQAMAYIDGGTSPTGDVFGARNWALHDITIDNLEINGHMSLGGITNFTFKNNAIHGGGHLDHVNLADPADSELIIAEDMVNLLVQNNKFYDCDGENFDRTTMFVYFGDSDANSAQEDNAIFEYNDFYQTSSDSPKNCEGLHLKDNPENITVRYNYFHDLEGRALYSANQDNGNDVFIHNNIFARNGYTEKAALDLAIEIRNVSIYNNVFFNNIYSDFWNRYIDTNWGYWNNINFNTESAFIRTGWFTNDYTPASVESSCNYLDYNNYFGTASWRNECGASCEDNISNLSSWQTYLDGKGVGAYEDNSISLNPNFTNSSGNYSLATDFKRTIYPINGRGGAYLNVMGAYITGNETIGYSASITSDITPPSHPLNLAVQ